jgi:hypothetical protein
LKQPQLLLLNSPVLLLQPACKYTPHTWQLKPLLAAGELLLLPLLLLLSGQAIAALDKALQANPESLEVLLALGVSHTNELDAGAATAAGADVLTLCCLRSAYQSVYIHHTSYMMRVQAPPACGR